MALGDLAEAQEMYNAYLAAEKAILNGQSYSLGSRSLSRADLNSVTQNRKFWRREVDRLEKSGGGIPVKGITPL